MRRASVVAGVLVGLIAGCGDTSRGERTTNTPAQAVRSFYAAAARDGDFQRACQFASPRFYLRPTGVAGINVKSDGHDVAPPAIRTKPRRGPCPRLVRRLAARFNERVPSFAYWKLRSVKMSPSGRQAEAVTEDGSVGLEVVRGEWRVLWAFDT